MLAVAPDRLASIPAAPGAYLLVDGRGRVLYAGRAGVLRSRVRSYWSASLDRPGLRGMVRRVRRILIAPAASEHEAALLERVLLERLDPPFNRTQGIEVLVALRVSTAPPQIAAVVELERNAPHFRPVPRLGADACRGIRARAHVPAAPLPSWQRARIAGARSRAPQGRLNRGRLPSRAIGGRCPRCATRRGRRDRDRSRTRPRSCRGPAPLRASRRGAAPAGGHSLDHPGAAADAPRAKRRWLGVR